ncbi:hypothetical protein [Halorhodospira halophila]|uniref:hypothetical protein n=1 Tax=Halorhodospira halophila TaxID=1053 RepID=UPI001911E4FD|nr:hypothetical protein [Halorhodospira halophila]MBK5935485.1 hypothetical protein [Halorhodospira halophila]
MTMAKTAAQRKREQRERLERVVDLGEPETWSEETCRYILSKARFKGTKTADAAWRQLGEIHAFVTVTEQQMGIEPRAAQDGRRRDPLRNQGPDHAHEGGRWQQTARRVGDGRHHRRQGAEGGDAASADRSEGIGFRMVGPSQARRQCDDGPW